MALLLPIHTPMNQEKYDLAVDDDCQTFKFISEGPRGKIQKMIVFEPLSGIDNYYNLCLGDWNEETQKLDDSIVSNNLDTLKILGTVAEAADSFLTANPDAVIFVSGSSVARNRLYQMNIGKYLGEVKSRFVVRGNRDKKWQSFKKGVNYDAFTLFRK
jgi:hypothetical protein